MIEKIPIASYSFKVQEALKWHVETSLFEVLTDLAEAKIQEDWPGDFDVAHDYVSIDTRGKKFVVEFFKKAKVKRSKKPAA